jgi:hypothetical protein
MLPFSLREIGFGMLLYGLAANIYIHQVLDISFSPSFIHRELRIDTHDNTQDRKAVTRQNHSQKTSSLRQLFIEMQQHYQGDKFVPSLQYLLQQMLSSHESDNTMDTEHDVLETDNTTEMETLCRKFHFRYNRKKQHHGIPRRIFWGSLVADDSWHIILLQAAESYNLFHTVAFVESNTTQTLTPRRLRYFVGMDDNDNVDVTNNIEARRLRHKALTHKQLWGHGTKVTVDLYVHNRRQTKNNVSPDDKRNKRKGLWLQNENLQRDLIIKRWKINGMAGDDIGIISDVDEVVSRDFLRALQVCDGIPPFSRHNNCKAPKITAPSLVVEGSPLCVVAQRKWQHPDIILGECIDGIANNANNQHPIVPRAPQYGAMMRTPKWEKIYDKVVDNNKRNRGQPSSAYYPLWSATDFRMEDATSWWPAKDIFPIAWHFHNFFDSLEDVRNKYLTYGHPVEEAASIPLENISRDLDFMVGCLLDRSERGGILDRESNVPWVLQFAEANGSAVAGTTTNAAYTHELATPRAFQLAPDYPRLRHEELRELVIRDKMVRKDDANGLNVRDKL